jgi:hypothetical protein
MCAAGRDDWTACADSFGRILAIATTWTTFAIWVEEHLRIKIATGALVLPFPLFHYGNR